MTCVVWTNVGMLTWFVPYLVNTNDCNFTLNFDLIVLKVLISVSLIFGKSCMHVMISHMLKSNVFGAKIYIRASPLPVKFTLENRHQKSDLETNYTNKLKSSHYVCARIGIRTSDLSREWYNPHSDNCDITVWNCQRCMSEGRPGTVPAVRDK